MIGGIGVRATLQKRGRGESASRAGGVVQRRLLGAVAGVGVRASREKQPDRFRPLIFGVEGGPVQRRTALDIRLVDLRAVVEEKLRDLGVMDRAVQRSYAKIVLGVGVRAFGEQQGHGFLVTIAG